MIILQYREGHINVSSSFSLYVMCNFPKNAS